MTITAGMTLIAYGYHCWDGCWRAAALHSRDVPRPYCACGAPAESLVVFRDLPITARELKATPAMLERIYEGAKLGLRGDSLALAAGMLPVELARLKLMDPIAEIAEMKGRADSEMTMSKTLYEAAEAGDSKAALEFLKHKHDWQTSQRIQVDVAQSISITAALEMAEKRVAAVIEDAVEIRPRLAPQALVEMADGPV